MPGKSGRLQSLGSQSQTQPSAHVPKEAFLHWTHPIFSLLSLRISFTRSPTLHTNLCKSCDSILKNPCGSPVPACIQAKSLQSCPTLCDPVDCSPPGFSVHGILQARIPEWIVMPFCRRSSRPRDRTFVSCSSCIGRQVLYMVLYRFFTNSIHERLFKIRYPSDFLVLLLQPRTSTLSGLTPTFTLQEQV